MEDKKFKEFIGEITSKIREYLPVSFEDCTIEVKTVPKNNGLILTGICVKKDNSHIAPVVYLNELFERYQNGYPISDILEIVAKRCAESNEVESMFDVSMISDFGSAKNRIIPKLINKEWNKEFLKSAVHTDFLDLAVIYNIIVNEGEYGTATTTVNKDILKNWGVSIEELHQTAIDNMMKLTPCEFKTMIEVLTGITGDPLPNDVVPDNVMWVLTNSKKINGASCALDDGMLQFIAGQIGNYFLIFSSIHESIIVKDAGLDENELKNMVVSINESQVSVDERLSDHVYHYDPENGLTIAA